MSYCINPGCSDSDNPDDDDQLKCCQACGTELLINERYRLIYPLHDLSNSSGREVWLVDNGGIPKVLKILTDNTPTYVKLYQREVKVLRQLSHPGIPRLEADFIFSPNNSRQKLYCLVMEKIEGENLDQWISKHGSISLEIALKWLKELTKILDYVHQQRLFHRDIKPTSCALETLKRFYNV